jgi:hypothetical protein
VVSAGSWEQVSALGMLMLLLSVPAMLTCVADRVGKHVPGDTARNESVSPTHQWHKVCMQGTVLCQGHTGIVDGVSTAVHTHCAHLAHALTGMAFPMLVRLIGDTKGC